MSRYPLFDLDAIRLQDIQHRGHQLLAQECLPLKPSDPPYRHPDFDELVTRVVQARRTGRPVILMMGAHPIKLGLSRFLVDLIERRMVTLLATNGAGLIHDYELAALGGTSEDVPRWIRRGQFGLWRQTGAFNDLVREAARRGEGLGEAVGRAIEQQQLPYRELSVAAAGWRAGVPVTSHVGIGSDIVHAHANCDGAAFGAASHTDFLIFARHVLDLEGGLFLNVGTAVTGPEVFLKALSMARNVAHQQQREIRRFTTAVFDLVALPDDFAAGLPGKQHAGYYHRPWKTLLVRTVADGGQGFSFCGDHRQTIPTLWQAAVTRLAGGPTGPAAGLPTLVDRPETLPGWSGPTGACPPDAPRPA